MVDGCPRPLASGGVAVSRGALSNRIDGVPGSRPIPGSLWRLVGEVRLAYARLGHRGRE